MKTKKSALDKIKEGMYYEYMPSDVKPKWLKRKHR